MRRALLLASPLLLLVPACDFLTPTVSNQKLEAALEQWLIEHEMEAHDIHCPDGEKLEKGNVFECTCQVHGTDIPVRVEVTDPSSGTVEWKPKYLTLHAEDFIAEVKENDAFKGHDLEITCTDKVLVSIPDSKWECQIVDKGAGNKAFAATVTFTDGQGAHNIEWTEK